MAISRRRPFIVRFPIGNSTGRGSEPVYSDNFVLHCEKGSRNGTVEKREYGTVALYDKEILVKANELTRNIGADTVFFIDEMPTSNNKYGDYVFEGKSDEVLGNFLIYLSKSKKNSYPKIFYLHHNGSVVSYQLNYDKKANVAYVPYDRFVPFGTNSKIWTKEPADIEDNTNRIVLKSTEQCGFTDTSRSHKKLVFLKYGIKTKKN